MSLATLRKKFLLDLPMRIGDHRPDGGKTLNRGSAGSDLDGVLGAGAAEPTKLAHRRGYLFDGGDDIQPSTGYSISSGLITVLMTVRLDDLAGSAVSSFFAWETASAVDVCLFLYVQSSDQLRFYCGGSSADNAANFVTGPIFQDNRLVTIGGVYDGTNTTIYINGVARATATTPLAPPATTHPIKIMERGGGGNNARGQVNHTGMSDKAFSPLDMAEYHYWMSRLCGRAREAA
jgi:hypothetical protein